jgi:hypothetical protein
VSHINLWKPCFFTEVPDGPQTYTLNVLWLQEGGAQIRCVSEAKASHSQRMWAEVSSSAPHLLHSGLSDSPIKRKCLLRVLCPVRWPVTALDCVLLKDRNLALAARQDTGISFEPVLGCHQKQERVEVIGGRGKRCKQLLDDLKTMERYCNLKEEALGHTLWPTSLGRGYTPVVKQTIEWMNLDLKTIFHALSYRRQLTGDLPTSCRRLETRPFSEMCSVQILESLETQ